MSLHCFTIRALAPLPEQDEFNCLAWPVAQPPVLEATVHPVMRITIAPQGPPRGSRRQLDQQRRQPALGPAQRQPARRPQQQPGCSSCPELQGRTVMVAGWMPGSALDQMPHPVLARPPDGALRWPNCKAPGVLVVQKWVEARCANAPRGAAWPR